MYNATVIEKTILHNHSMILKVEPDQMAGTYSAGQYVTIGLSNREGVCPWCEINDPDASSPERLIKRPYFITSDPDADGYLEFYIALIRSGKLTPRLFALEQGRRIYIGERSESAIDIRKVAAHKHLLFFSTGTGISPYISIIRKEIGVYPTRRFIVVQGAKYSWDLGFRDELSMLAKITPLFYYFPVVSSRNNDPDWGGFTGTIEDFFQMGYIEEMTKLEISPNNMEIFLCGAPDMITPMIELLYTFGFSSGSAKPTLHIEKY